MSPSSLAIHPSPSFSSCPISPTLYNNLPTQYDWNGFLLWCKTDSDIKPNNILSYYQVHFKTDEKYQQGNFYKKGFFWGDILKWATPLSSFEMLSQFYCFCCCFLAQNFNRLRIRSWWETYHIKPTSHVWKYQENRSDSIFGFSICARLTACMVSQGETE